MYTTYHGLRPGSANVKRVRRLMGWADAVIIAATVHHKYRAATGRRP